MSGSAPENENVLESLGMSELDLQRVIARARRSRTHIVEVDWPIYDKWLEIQALFRAGDLTHQNAETRFEREVFPHLGLRPGVDYDPQADIVNIVPKRPVRSIGLA